MCDAALQLGDLAGWCAGKNKMRDINVRLDRRMTDIIKEARHLLQVIDQGKLEGFKLERDFETEPFGNRTIAVKASPAAIAPQNLEKVLFEILEIAEDELRGVSMDDIRRNIAASIACRAAIKVNMRLEHKKMDWLLRTLAATSCPMSCPHGRPIALHYPMREILKAFHRI